ncbi:MAG: hypothetical protein A2015_02510 [Spirochaetes bacterium GWF1_31_7]|nr:MAG: hypothetical protein A2Y30_04920 [Spirochaetes bacterium GWE1_32_154]OHD52894.1 MAG: hypothetical protein A2Y29_10630 [Spirochaetes bacterium GWE2_31_10]OHD53151.1 MAG: hypothetical protein A2015_02510 [Spirochaetes bacterium GWF1_31_7]HBD93572.1 hypothetical protein [Spirochaetia bacterium]HBI38301.1 hypothetical protein [Spirochaetia bacterium]
MDIEIVKFTLFISLSFFCSGSETALFSLNHSSLEDIINKYPKRGAIINHLLSNPQKLLLSIIFVNIFANIFVTLTANSLFSHYFPTVPLAAQIIIITLFILIFGETTPKSIAISFNRKVSLTVAPLFYILSKILYPVIFLMSKVANFLVNINSYLFFRNEIEAKYYKSDEMIEVIQSSKSLGIIEEQESDILKNIIEFAETDIWKIMRPRDEIFSLSIDDNVKDIIKVIQEKKYSRIPVWKDDDENIIGILYAKEILHFKTNDEKLLSYKKYLREPIFIPETSSAEKILEMFKKTNNHLAIVIDEYGGIAGLITLEDILETILGDIVDKNDVVPLYHRYNHTMIEVDARMELTEFNEVFETDLKSNEAVTIGGYLLEKIKRIPKVSEIFMFNNLQFKVSGAQPHKIEKMMISKINKFHRKKSRNNT